MCNDDKFFKGSLVPADVSVPSATGLSNRLVMGIAFLILQDDDGVQHIFNLQRVRLVYMPQWLVNISSTKRLAEPFPTKSGAPDKKGAGVTSLLTCRPCAILGQQKVQQVSSVWTSDLPELLFSTNYSWSTHKLDIAHTPVFLPSESNFKSVTSVGFLIENYIGHDLWIFCKTSKRARLPTVFAFCFFVRAFATVSALELKIDFQPS